MGFSNWAVSGCVFDHSIVTPEIKEVTSSKGNPLRDGIEAYNNGHLDRAKIFFEKVILNRQGSQFLMEAQWMLGQTYERQGKWERAIVEYQSLIRNFPRNPHFDDGYSPF